MRTKSLATVVVIALAGVLGFSVIGQEEPLPPVAPKYVAPEVTIVDPVIVLASEPIREYTPPTIAGAARNNDYVTFDALYAAAKKRGENVAQWDTLHELWTYSITDPIGAFYGEELHARLSRAYPDFGKYIEPYRIVDDRGQVFYPMSETRAFLLAHVGEAKPVRAPRVQVADVTPSVARRPAARAAAKPVATTPPPRSLAPARDDKPAAEPAPPAVEQPIVITAEPARAPAPVVTQPAQPAPQPSHPANTRGILLLIVGLIGIGLLALVLRTPREQPTVFKPNPDNVEPLRKPQAAPPPPPTDTRATG